MAGELSLKSESKKCNSNSRCLGGFTEFLCNTMIHYPSSGLLKTSRELGCEDLLLLTDSDRGMQKESWHRMSGMVRRMPIADWLLNSPYDAGKPLIIT